MRVLHKISTTKIKNIFGYFALLTFFVYLGDAIMAYAIPLFINEKISDPFWAGVIFAFSSFIGLIFNFLAGELFGNKSRNFFVKCTVFVALAFPISFILAPDYIPAYLFGLAAWGIYFETQAFAAFKFIELSKKKEEYSEAWSFVSTIMSLAYFIGPLIATYLIETYIGLNFYIAIACYLLAFAVFRIMNSKQEIKEKGNQKTGPVTPLVEMKIWKIYMKPLWPLWIFGFALFMIEAFFWTIGVVFAEGLKEKSDLAGLMLSLHVLPTILIGSIMSKIKIKTGKKKLALTAGMIAGCILFGFNWATSVNHILSIVVGYSIFSSIALTLVSATYEDFVARESKYENDLIGLEQSAASLAFVIGPIIAGSISELVGEQIAMAYSGGILVLVALFIVLIMPKKIHMPHRKFEKM
jgi:MFS family permease